MFRRGGVDRANWTDAELVARCTRSAFFGVDVQHRVRTLRALHRTHIDAPTILRGNAGLGDDCDVSTHSRQLPRLRPANRPYNQLMGRSDPRAQPPRLYRRPFRERPHRQTRHRSRRTSPSPEPKPHTDPVPENAVNDISGDQRSRRASSFTKIGSFRDRSEITPLRIPGQSSYRRFPVPMLPGPRQELPLGVRSCRRGLVGPIGALPRLGVVEDESVTGKVNDLGEF